VPDPSSPRPLRRPSRAAAPVAGTLLACLVALAAACGAVPSPRAGAGEGTVVRVIDGDTLVVRLATGDEHVRLIGIDTPETKRPGTPVECFGAEASAHLAELLPEGSAVHLERDVDERDRYGRLLAYAHRASDDLFVNGAMVADGFAAAYTVAPNVARTTELTDAARSARATGLGLWGRCGGGHQPLPP
jgi:micrococcal nuclease